MEVPQVSPGSDGQPGTAGSPGRPRASAGSARIPRDDEDLRNKKSLLVLLAVLILPVSIVWGSSYLAFGSPVGILPFIYLSISVASLVFFAKTKRFMPFLIVQLLDVMLMTALGQMLSGGFLPSGGVALWGFLAPLGALVFLEVRQAIGWFIAFVVTFLVLGIVGELFFPDVDVPAWFTTTMLALNVIGTGAVAFTVLASFAHQRNEALAALRVEQATVRSAHHERAAELDRGTTEGRDGLDRRPRRVRHDPVRRPRELHAARPTHGGGRRGGHPRSAVLPLRHARRTARTREDQDDRGCVHGRGGRARPVRRPRDQGRQAGARHARGDRRLRDRRVWRPRTADRHQLRTGHGRRDRHEALPLRPVGRRREHGEPHGVQRHARRDPDHALDLRADQGCVRLHAARLDPDQGQGRDGDLVPRRTDGRLELC